MIREALRVEHIGSLDRFLQLGDGWSDLESGPGGRLAPTLTHEWFAIWLDAFGGDSTISTIALFDGKHLVGVAPLHIVLTRYRGIPCRQLRLLHNRHAPACTFLVKAGYEGAVDYLMEETLALPGWDMLRFDNVPRNTHLHPVCAALAESGGSAIFRQTMSSPLLEIKGPWNAFFESRSRKTKRSLRSNEKKLLNAGRVEIDHFADAESSVGIMPTVLAIGNRSWKAAGGRAIGSQAESARFYTRLATIFGKREEVSIWVLRLDGRPVAFEFHLVRNGRVHGLRAEFDDDFRPLGVGSVLDKEIVKRLFEMGMKEYDMGGSADFYKLRWTREAVDHHEFLSFGTSLTARLLSLFEHHLVVPLKSLRRGHQACYTSLFSPLTGRL